MCPVCIAIIQPSTGILYSASYCIAGLDTVRWQQEYMYSRLAGQSILRGLGLVNCQSSSSSGIVISCMTS